MKGRATMKMRDLIEQIESGQSLDEETYYQPYDLEIGDIGISYSNRDRGRFLTVFHPLSSIGKRGKRITVLTYALSGFRGEGSWIHNMMSDLSGKSRLSPKQLEDEIERQMEIYGGEVQRVDSEQVKATSKGLPIPQSMQVDSIDGVDITVDLNSNPIRISSRMRSDDLAVGRMTYSWEVPRRYAEKLLSLRREIEKVRGYNAMMDLLNKNGIKSKSMTYMMPGFD
jgi:hypothetical protein